MAYLSFNARKGTIGLSPFRSLPELKDWSLGLEVEPLDKLLDDFRLATGEKLSEVRFSVGFKLSDEPTKEWLKKFGENALGLVRYFPYSPPSYPVGATPATVAAEVYVDQHTMTELIAFARQGRYPGRVTIEINSDEVDYGYGGDMTWKNTKEHHHSPIIGFHFELPLDAPEPEPIPERKDYEEPKTHVGADLAPLLKQSIDLQRWTLMILGGLVVLVAGAILR